MFVVFAGNDGVVNQFFTDHFAQVFVVRQFFGETVVISQIFFVPHAVHQNHFFKHVVDFRVFGNGQEGGDACACGKQVEVFAGIEVAGHQCAGGLFADEDFVADFEVLQAAGQRAVLHFDAEKFEVFFVVCAGDAVCAHQRFAVHHQADHDELAVFKTQGFVAGAGEGEIGVRPVVYGQDFLDVVGCHFGFPVNKVNRLEGYLRPSERQFAENQFSDGLCLSAEVRLRRRRCRFFCVCAGGGVFSCLRAVFAGRRRSWRRVRFRRHVGMSSTSRPVRGRLGRAGRAA